MRRLITFLIVLSLLTNGALALVQAEQKMDTTSKTQTVDSEVSVIIGFKDKVDMVREDSLKSKGFKIKRSLKEINAVSVRVYKSTLDQLSTDPNVAYIVPNEKILKIAGDIIPWGISKINAPLVYNTYNGSGIVVAILDTGIDYNHEDLLGKYIPANSYDYVNIDNDPMDDNGHGTHVAGTIGANNNSIGVIGVAPGVQILAMKMLDASGSGYLADGVSAIMDATNDGAKIISMSWGWSGSDYAPMKSAIQFANSKGVLLVAAAGNSGNSNIIYPAAYPEVIAVTATDGNDKLASFSSYGPKAEISAPGVDVYSTVPTGTCMLCSPTGYNTLSGTSMATPHVSGAAAVLWQEHPTFSNTEIRNLLDTYAKDLGTPGRDSYFGFGRLDVYSSSIATLPPTPTITVLTPNGGESWNRANPYEITWGSANNPGANVVIRLLKNGVVDSTIASSTANDGSYIWTIPSSKALGADYKIRVTSTTNSAYTDDSNNTFTITALVNPISIIAPAGGEQWRRSSSYNIKWTGSDGNVKIELLKANLFYSTIASNTANSGTYRWSISRSQVLGNDYKIRVTSNTDSTKFGISNVFTIQN